MYAEIAAIVVAILALIGTALTAIFAFRGGLPAAADEVARSFQTLNQRQQEEISKLEEKIEAYEQRIAYLESAAAVEKRFSEQLLTRIDRQSRRIAEQSRKISRQEKQIAMLTGGIQVLVRQLDDQGIKPEWTPPPFEETPPPKSRGGDE